MKTKIAEFKNKCEEMIDADTQKNISIWLQGDFDEGTKNEIRRLQKSDSKELSDAFYKHMSFGTGGLRGIMGVGTNRMNLYTIRSATQGLANYILKQNRNQKKHSVFVGFDCRHLSREFAEESARVLAANGIEVYIYKELRPVANVAFGVLHKKCTAGIMITASHNPPKYNGYKVYWSYGGQILPPHDQHIIDEVDKVTPSSPVKTVTFHHPLIHTVQDEIDTAYLEAIRKWQLHPEDNRKWGNQIKIIYTSLHGAGITMIPQALLDWGFTNFHIVQEQQNPDGHFPTVKSPNPEEQEAMEIGIEKLKELQGDILLGTDPDTDRLGVVVMDKGDPVFFDGNQVACLLAEHVCSSLMKSYSMPPQPMFIKTIVTTELFKKITEHYQATCLNVLTGFKYVGEKIHQWEQEGAENPLKPHFILAAEESYGYLLGTHVRDKDAIIAAACICEAALQMKRRNKTLVDLLYEIYLQHGVYREKLLCLTCEGKEGAEQIQHLMNNLRQNPPKAISNLQVVAFEDYQNRIQKNLRTGHIDATLLPQSDVLLFWLEDATKIVIRPSGTEPKIKIYCAVMEKQRPTSLEMVEKTILACDRRLEGLINTFKKTFTIDL